MSKAGQKQSRSVRAAWPLIFWVGAATAAFFAFLTPEFDLWCARLFFDGTDPSNPWPFGKTTFFRFLYALVPWLTAAFLVGSGFLLLQSRRRKSRESRKRALFLFLCMVIGPGLVVNAILKEHAGRPRPRAIGEFGGTEQYHAPWHFGGEGHSFPCGHCSVAFTYPALHPVLRRRHPALAEWIIPLAVAGGLIIGAGRMAAGAHFLSDIIWAGLIVWAVILILQRAMRLETPEPDVERST